MESTEAKVREIVASVTGLPKDVAPNADLYLELGVASVHALNLLTQLESQFGVAIPDEEFVTATSIASLTTLMTGLTQDAPKGEHAGQM